MLNDVGHLLGDIQVPGRPAFDANVFTQPHLPNRIEDLQEAILLWTCMGRDHRTDEPKH
jgi:hypothetical protein